MDPKFTRVGYLDCGGRAQRRNRFGNGTHSPKRRGASPPVAVQDACRDNCAL